MSYQEQPGWGAPAPMGGQEHPKSTTVLVLGILGLICCSPLAIVAVVMGGSARKETQSGQYVEGTSLKVGYILGWVGVGLMIFGAIIWAILLATGSATFSGSTSSDF